MLTIYHWEPNANSGKPMLAALEKGVEFESRYIDMLSFEQHAPAYLQVNPNGAAERASLMVGDLLLGLTMDDLSEAIGEAAGSVLKLQFRRGGRHIRREVSVAVPGPRREAA